MKRKNKQRASNKRRQRAAVRDKARQQVNRQAREVAQSIRRMARSGQGIDARALSEDIRYTLDDAVEIPHCGGAGECCKNREIIRLNTDDVWRILHNKEICEEFGIKMTYDLYGDLRERKLLNYWLEPRTGIPMCAVRRDQKLNGVEECVFLRVDDKGNHICALGDDRPMVCKANPLGRIGKTNDHGDLVGWEYINSDGVCGRCVEKEKCETKKIKVEDWLLSREMEVRYYMSDMFHGLIMWLDKKVRQDEFRKLAAMFLYDWDTAMGRLGGTDEETVIANRPDAPEQIIATTKRMIESFMTGKLPEENDIETQLSSDAAGKSNEG